MKRDQHRQIIGQFKARLPVATVEVLWVMGDAVPVDFNLPPGWVKKAIERIAKETGLPTEGAEPDAKTTPHLIGQYTGFLY